jgi:hypothetical protein
MNEATLEYLEDLRRLDPSTAKKQSWSHSGLLF